jgi:hypothetical protein
VKPLARMIPATVDDFNASFGEQQVYNALRDGLPDDYVVFHSFHWNRKGPNRVEWGETDFTVFHPKYGILVIEVKSGGIILEDGRWWYTRDDTLERFPMKDPLEQACRTMYAMKELVEKALPDGEYCWVEPVVWFPSLSDRETIGSLPNTYHREIVLMAWALQNPEKAIRNAYEFYNNARHTNISPDSAKLIVRTLAPAFNAVQSLSSVYAEQEYRFLRLTQEQSHLLDNLDEQPVAVIHGGAGTGKTLLAVEKARRLSVEDRVLFLCFNRFLMLELRRRNQEYPNISFYNLPALVVRDTGVRDDFNDEVITDYLNRYDEFGTWDYKHIIVDEGQDFCDTHLNLLATIAQIQGGVFYVFYDKYQLVHRRELPDWVCNAECRLVLKRNCRNTIRIATTAARPIDVDPVLWELSPDGNTPDFYIMSDVESLIKKLGELIAKYVDAQIPLDQITILTAKTEEKSVLADIDKVGKWQRANKRDSPGTVFFTTARKFKGLESAVIIMIDVDAATFETPEARNLFYVGASRARHFLDVVTVLDDAQLKALCDALSGQSDKKTVAKIASALKVRIVKETKEDHAIAELQESIV